MYSELLAPPHFSFWATLVVGFIFTFVPYFYKFNRSDKLLFDWNDYKGVISFGVFSALTTVVVLHLFGDSRILGWLYIAPDPDALIAPLGVFSFSLIALASIGILFAIRQDNGVLAIFGLVASMILFQFVTGLPVFPWLVHHWMATLGIFLGNLLIGSAWAIFWKWDSLVANNRRRYDLIRSKWLQSKGLEENSDFTLENKLEWEKYFKGMNRDEYGLIEFRPRYRDHKSELIGWMVLWPVSVFETFLFDVVSDLFRQLYEYMGGLLDVVMKRRWQGTESHMLSDEEREIMKQQRKP